MSHWSSEAHEGPPSPKLDPYRANDDLQVVISERLRVTDLGLMALIPSVLLGVFILPKSLKWNLVLEFADPTIFTVFSNHFVHFSFEHFFINFAGYLLVISSSFLLALAGGQRRQFVVIFIVFHIVLPFVLSGLNLMWNWPGFGYGYSGIVMAFVGYLPLVLLPFVRSRLGLPVSHVWSTWLFLISVAIAAFIALPETYSIPIAFVAVLATIAFILQTTMDMTWISFSKVKHRLGVPGNIELTAFTFVLVMGYPFVGFTPKLVVDDGILNVYAHGLGLAFGYSVPYIGVWIGRFFLD